MVLRKLSILLSAIGLFLLILNLTGVFKSLRHKDIYQLRQGNKFGIELSEKQFHKELKQIMLSKESDSLTAVKVSHLVNRSMAHYYNPKENDLQNIKKYNLRIPIYENYILFLRAWNKSRKDDTGLMGRRHEFLNWRKAIERGLGLCSQHAIIVSEILNEAGIQSKMIGLSGHVVPTAKISDDKWIILDPDYGVNIPFSIQEVEENTELIEPFYLVEGYNNKTINELKRIFSKEGNRIVENAKVYTGKTGKIERRSYWVIWVIPIILIVLSFVIPKLFISK